MHTQGARLQDPNGCFLITPRAINPGINLVEESFDPDMETDECTAWMRWDVGAVETDLATSDRKYRIVSTQSICDASNASPTSAYSIQNEFVYEDVPFEFDETIEASQFPTTTQMLQDLQRPTQGCSVLTAIEQQRLEAIAMPFLIVPQTNIEPESPITLSYTVSPSPSPSPSPDIKPTTSKLRKWKSLVEDNEAPNTLCQSRKRDHNAIEKRYRTNLNDKISCLREGIPPLWRRSGRETSRDEGEDSDNENTARQPSSVGRLNISNIWKILPKSWASKLRVSRCGQELSKSWP
jgi:hypothetical protein